MRGLNLQPQVYAQQKGETTLHNWTWVDFFPDEFPRRTSQLPSALSQWTTGIGLPHVVFWGPLPHLPCFSVTLAVSWADPMEANGACGQSLLRMFPGYHWYTMRSFRILVTVQWLIFTNTRTLSIHHFKKPTVRDSPGGPGKKIRLCVSKTQHPQCGKPRFDTWSGIHMHDTKIPWASIKTRSRLSI